MFPYWYFKKNEQNQETNRISIFQGNTERDNLSNNNQINIKDLEIIRLNNIIYENQKRYEQKIKEQEDIINEGLSNIDKVSTDLKKEKDLNKKLKENNEKYLRLINEKDKEIKTLNVKISNMNESLNKNNEKNEKVNINEIIVINFIYIDL